MIQARVVVVANNAYETGLLSPGERASLDEGTLHLYTTRRVLRDGWEDRAGTRFVLDAPRHRLRAAIDGEPAVLETPVEFRVEPRALRLLVPPGL